MDAERATALTSSTHLSLRRHSAMEAALLEAGIESASEAANLPISFWIELAGSRSRATYWRWKAARLDKSRGDQIVPVEETKRSRGTPRGGSVTRCSLLL